MSIFKAYDIRGIYPDELDEDIAYKIGRAFVSFLNTKEVLVGKDMRESSDKLLEALTRGIMEQGANIVYIGLCSTPMFYFAAHEAKSAIMVTASHNPGKYNGFKMLRENVTPISGASGLQEIRKLVEKNSFEEIDKKGKIVEKNVMNEFVEHNLKFLNKDVKKLKLVVDAGNGMGGFTFPKIFEKIDCEFVPMYIKPDGSFPNHEANPIKPENIKDLQKRVVEERADFGVALDGDADRCVFVDEKGEIVRSDLTLALIAEHFLRKNKGSKILYNLICSWTVKETIEKNGGIPVMSKVGHASIKKKMREQDIIFGGETSGHFYYKENGFAESTIITTLIVMNILSEKNKKLSELAAPFKKYFKIDETNFEVGDKEGKIREIEKVFSDGKSSHLDGLTVEYDDWWFNLRPSNTEPLLRLSLEAKTKEKMEEMTQKISRIITG